MSDVCFLRGCSGDFSLVDDVFCVTVSIHGARVGFLAIAVLLLIVGACGFVNFSFVMIRYYCSDVSHAAVASFKCVKVKNFVKGARRREMFIDK